MSAPQMPANIIARDAIIIKYPSLRMLVVVRGCVASDKIIMVLNSLKDPGTVSSRAQCSSARDSQ